MIPSVRFAGSCSRCGMQLREYDRTLSNNWIPEVHEIADCIRFLTKRIENLESPD
jgi:transcription initiation factor IIE alpha subunit